jgi:hypothetical protein
MALPNLIEISLKGNKLTGSIPDWSSLPLLQILDLNDNLLEGSPFPFKKGSFPRLEVYSVKNNRLMGNLSPIICTYSKLMYLNLASNILTGPILECIENLEELSFLILKGNHFNGQIPENLNKLENLVLLDLRYNEFKSIAENLNIHQDKLLLNGNYFPVNSFVSIASSKSTKSTKSTKSM